ETVTITGTNLSGATAVLFGSTPASTYSVQSSTSIMATVPSGLPLGVVHTTVTTAEGTSATSAADELTVLPLTPTVSAVSPASGPASGGTDVTITGTDFSDATAVTIGGNPVASF